MLLTSLVIVLSSIILCAFFSGVETGNYTINRIRMLHKEQQGDSVAITLSKNIKDSQIFVFMTLIGNNIGIYLATDSVTELFINYEIAGEKTEIIWGFFPWSAEIAATMALMLPFFIFAEVAPKNLFRLKADVLMYATAYVQRFFVLITYPLTYPLKKLTEALMKNSDEDYGVEIKNLNLKRLKFFLEESREEGTINDSQSKMINNTLGLSKKRVDDIYIPTHDIVGVEYSEISLRKCIEVFRTNNINHLPVYKRKASLIVGYINIFDLIKFSQRSNHGNIKSIVRPIISIKSKMNLQKAFFELKKVSGSIAVVKNSREEAVGIIKLKDILRSITNIK